MGLISRVSSRTYRLRETQKSRTDLRSTLRESRGRLEILIFLFQKWPIPRRNWRMTPRTSSTASSRTLPPSSTSLWATNLSKSSAKSMKSCISASKSRMTARNASWANAGSSKLKSELDAAWKMVDTAHDKETRARETINALKTEINELSKLVEKGAGLSVGQENSVNQLIGERDQLRAQIDEQTSELTTLRAKHDALSSSLSQIEKEREIADNRAGELQQDLQMRINELQREQRKRDKLDREVTNLKRRADEKSKEVESNKTRLREQEDVNSSLNEQYKQIQVQLERTKKESEILNQRLTKIQQDYQNQVIQSDHLAAENQKKLAELKSREDEIAGMKSEAIKLTKMREQVSRRLQVIEDQKIDVEKERDSLKLRITGLEMDLDQKRKHAEADKKKQDDLVRERDILSKNL